MRRVMKIGTHSGMFHTDEALACYMLKKLPEYSNAEIVRSRDKKDLDPCDIVVDVGGIYDPTTNRYDHHQKTFQMSMKSVRSEIKSDIKLSSAGLVYHHFGDRVLEAIMGKSLEEIQKDKLFSYVYFNFVQEVDAVDNGIPMHETAEKLYSINTDLSSRIKHLNPSSEKSSTLEHFERAMNLAGQEFEECVYRFRDSWWPARSTVQSAIEDRYNVHSSGEIIFLKFCSWKLHVFEIETEENIEGAIKFAVFGDDNDWRVCAVPLSPNNFILRVPLYKEWWGLRDEELQKTTGITDAAFVHANGFIGGAKTKEGALAMAIQTLKLNKDIN